MAVSNLVTTGGLTTSDLITLPQWTLLGSYTTNGAVSTITISSIPGTYRTLRLVAPYITGTAYAYGYLRVNGVSTTIYQKYAMSESSNVMATNLSSDTLLYINNNGGTTNFGFTLDIENYSSSTEYKYVKGESYYNTSGNPNKDDIKCHIGTTSPITSITFVFSSGTMNVNSGPATGLGFFVYGGK
ncbi:hypothetical protein EB001_27225 [bacterium]|nr:hypothetical protein [bacterium]